MDDYDEWDPSRGPLPEHVIAGSTAGLAEHLVMYPVDTIKVRSGRTPMPVGRSPLAPAPRAVGS